MNLISRKRFVLHSEKYSNTAEYLENKSEHFDLEIKYGIQNQFITYTSVPNKFF